MHKYAKHVQDGQSFEPYATKYTQMLVVLLKVTENLYSMTPPAPLTWRQKRIMEHSCLEVAVHSSRETSKRSVTKSIGEATDATGATDRLTYKCVRA